MEEVLSFVLNSEVANKIKEKGFGEFVLRCANAQYETFVKSQLSSCDNQEVAEKLSSALTDVSQNQRELRKGFETLRNTCKNIDEKANKLARLGIPLSGLNVGLSFANLLASAIETHYLSEKIDQLREGLAEDLNEIKQGTKKLYQIEIDKFKSEYDSIVCKAGTLAESLQDGDDIKKESYTEVITDIKVFISKSITGVCDNTIPFELVINRIEDLLPVYTEFLAKYQDFYYGKKGKSANIKRFLSVYDEVLTKEFIEKYREHLFLIDDEHYIDCIDTVNEFESGVIWQVMYLDYNKKLLELLTTEEYSSLKISLDKYVKAKVKERLPEASKVADIAEEQAMEMLALTV